MSQFEIISQIKKESENSQDSVQNHGSEFHLILPRSNTPKDEKEPSNHSPDGNPPEVKFSLPDIADSEKCFVINPSAVIENWSKNVSVSYYVAQGMTFEEAVAKAEERQKASPMKVQGLARMELMRQAKAACLHF